MNPRLAAARALASVLAGKASLGSSLPPQIEHDLAERAVNLENRWYGSTRFTAWAQLALPAPAPLDANFGRVQLVAAGSAPAATI